MADCEICGNEEAMYYVAIAGAKLWACSSCAQGGKILKAKELPKPPVQKKETIEMEIVPDFDARIRNARAKMKLPLAVIAERINEKEGYLARIEEGKTIPTELIAQKLERELAIKLFEQSIKTNYKFDSGSGKETTLGDLVVIKKKKTE